jgi:hypothetical protein
MLILSILAIPRDFLEIASVKSIIVSAFVGLVFSLALADDPFTAAELEAGAIDRQEEIKRSADEVSSLEESKRKTKDRNRKQVLTQQIIEKKRELNAIKRKSPEDYARVRREVRDEERRKLSEAAKKQEEEAKADIERMKVSGNCPLRVDFATFAHLSDVNSIAMFHNVDAATTLGLTPISVVVFEVTNRTPQEVEAWEMSYELLDGFDQVLHEGSHRNPLVAPGKTARIRLSTRHMPEAVQMRVHVERSKSSDGTLWERTPEHKEVGASVRKLEGADFLKHMRD